MPDHTYYKCPGGDDHCQPRVGSCTFCDGGLAFCDVCCGGEGALATECPGRKMTDAESDAVYAGRLDFRNGTWIEVPPSEVFRG